ncbi:hypothetical protein BDBG_04848 [Blastomyces gilchristii SLH14081]|uniref:Ca2+-modulated nonselective cation channel polycystin n=1 Tax=Blastomyces gilchristii (strain SLH14081) TaxID=559298 RepID=A0A179UKI4_BLAGS|nr:uncharacterized protein BDBG_04848 [Blastomyces gilchristii SLH14081]OAT08586.1 hypothetical protein BDBG_04848 [Blastomyces gilchristii SLH14081]
MASTEVSPRHHDRHGRRRPFANWMKRLASLKNSGSHPSSSNKQNGTLSTPKAKKATNIKNNPYPLSGNVSNMGNGHLSFSEPTSDRLSHHPRSERSFSETGLEQRASTVGTKSAAPTLSTNADTTVSDTANSKTGTTVTTGWAVGSQGGGEGSTFSSPAPSVRSLTTTLTTVQSTAPSNQVHGAIFGHSTSYSHNQQTSVQFSHQFHMSPATAVPAHLSPNPTTYNSATANNLLTDNASVLTLASSSKRRRRNSLDTNASVRALAPSSIFSGSGESLPLSVLSGNMGNIGGAGVEPSNSSITNTQGAPNRPALANAERGSVYYSGPTTGERTSYQPSWPHLGDTGSGTSSHHSHHQRNDSAAGSVGGNTIGNSSMPRLPGRASRRSSGWGEVPSTDDSENEIQVTRTDEPSINLVGNGQAKAN